MFLESLELTNFRNYKSQKINFDLNTTLIIGKNAQGKTNIIEAIYYLSSLKSFRALQSSEMVRIKEQYARIKADIVNIYDIEHTLEVIINPPNKRVIKVDGVTKRLSYQFCSNLKAVIFTVNDLLIVKGMSENRRRWLDFAINQLYPLYFDKLNMYNKIRLQKNNLLKKSKLYNNLDRNLLEVFNNQLVICGTNIIMLRLKFLKSIKDLLYKNHKAICQNEDLTFKYISNILNQVEFEDDKFEFSSESIVNIFKEKLEENEQFEIMKSQSLIGPHRDDLAFFINNIDSKKFASQGQQRTIVLALKLAELSLLREKFEGAPPLLLLDDVLAELDDRRQDFLLNSIENNTQTIITSVDTLQFSTKYLQNCQLIHISEGKVI